MQPRLVFMVMLVTPQATFSFIYTGSCAALPQVEQVLRQAPHSPQISPGIGTPGVLCWKEQAESRSLQTPGWSLPHVRGIAGCRKQPLREPQS